jgi:glycerophosphoryl diester phosphodiesterase
MLANIEIKPLRGQEEKTVEKALEVICAHWKNKKHPPLLSSFSLKTLEYLRALSSHVQLAYLLDEWDPHWKEVADRLGCVSIHCNEKIISPERIMAIQSTDRKVLAYTVNHADRAKELFFYGIDAIFSDCPDKLLMFI